MGHFKDGRWNALEDTKPWIFLAILRNSKRVQFFYFGIVFLKSESNSCVESLKSNSMRVFETINWWTWNHLLDLQLQKLRIGLPWSCIESYCLV